MQFHPDPSYSVLLLNIYILPIKSCPCANVSFTRIIQGPYCTSDKKMFLSTWCRRQKKYKISSNPHFHRSGCYGVTNAYKSLSSGTTAKNQSTPRYNNCKEGQAMGNLAYTGSYLQLATFNANFLSCKRLVLERDKFLPDKFVLLPIEFVHWCQCDQMVW